MLLFKFYSPKVNRTWISCVSNFVDKFLLELPNDLVLWALRNEEMIGKSEKLIGTQTSSPKLEQRLSFLVLFNFAFEKYILNGCL